MTDASISPDQTVRDDEVWAILERFEDTINGVKQVIAVLPGRCRKADADNTCPYYKRTEDSNAFIVRSTCLFHMRSVYEIKNCIFRGDQV